MRIAICVIFGFLIALASAFGVYKYLENQRAIDAFKVEIDDAKKSILAVERVLQGKASISTERSRLLGELDSLARVFASSHSELISKVGNLADSNTLLEDLRISRPIEDSFWRISTFSFIIKKIDLDLSLLLLSSEMPNMEIDTLSGGIVNDTLALYFVGRFWFPKKIEDKLLDKRSQTL